MQHPATDMDDRRAIDPMQDPQVRAFLNEALPKVVEAFTAHPEEMATRREAMPLAERMRCKRSI